MPTETVITIILAILGAIGTWTVTVALLVLWLSNRFTALTLLIDSKINATRIEHDRDIESIWKRLRAIERQVHRLQLKVFGFAPLRGDEMLDRLAEMDSDEATEG